MAARTKSLSPVVPLDRGADGIPVGRLQLGSWRLLLERKALSPAALSEAYSRAAPRWSRLISWLGFDAAYEALLRTQGLRGGRILEAGAGTGAFTSALARVTGRPFAVAGLDVSGAMLQRALASWRAVGLAASGSLGDIRRLPYADESFDLVLAAHVLEHLPDPEHAASELVRVLRPGGTAVIIATRCSLFGRWLQWRWRVRCFAPEELVQILPGTVTVNVLPLPGPLMCRWMSLACVVNKDC